MQVIAATGSRPCLEGQQRPPEVTQSPTERQQAYSLRARLRYLLPSAREAACGRVVVEHIEDGHPHIEVRTEASVRRATWKGLATCGHIWTCPVCSHKLRTERAGRIGAAVEGLGGQWCMLTVTLRHRQGMPLAVLYAALTRAWRRTRQGGKVQRIWGQRVTASVRATEVTYGDNGWHPHVHVLLHTTAWSDEEKASLLLRWKCSVERELGKACLPSDARALTWSESFDAGEASGRERYLAKVRASLELSGKGKRGGRSHWQLARDAADGDARALQLWQEFYRGTKGRRMIELDDRAQAAAERQLMQSARDDGGPAERTIIPVTRDDVRALRILERVSPWVFASVLSSAEEGGAVAVDGWCAYAREHVRTDDWPGSAREDDAPS